MSLPSATAWSWVLLSPAVLWACGSILLSGGDASRGPGILRGLVCVALLALMAWDRRPRSAVVLVGVGAAAFYLARPRLDRRWSEDQARLPSVSWQDEHRFTVHDLRAFRYRSPEDWDPIWVDRVYDLDHLQGVDLGVEHFSAFEAVAHTFLVFRFADGRDLAVSIEIRKEQGESFSPVRGLYRQYESMIVLAEPEDLLELRLRYRRNPVVLHPLQVGPDAMRSYLRVILDDVAQRADTAVWYHTVTGSCSSTLAHQLRRTAGVSWDWRMFVPGHVDELVWELGWLGDVPLDEQRRAHLLAPPAP